MSINNSVTEMKIAFCGFSRTVFTVIDKITQTLSNEEFLVMVKTALEKAQMPVTEFVHTSVVNKCIVQFGLEREKCELNSRVSDMSCQFSDH